MNQIKASCFCTEWTDVRDGLFPSLRYALMQLKNMSDEIDGRFLNSKRFVEKVAGDCKANPYDLYDALVNSACPHSTLELVDGHGIMGFPPADMCFSEMRVSNLYRQINDEYNNSTDFNKPLYTPLPLVLSNGTLNRQAFIPSHNIGEVIDATIALIKDPNLETKDLLKYIKGPDLIVGGEIINCEHLHKVYEQGYGIIQINITPQTIRKGFGDEISDFCRWYNIPFRKYLTKKEDRILMKYEAKLFNGQTVKFMSLKEILQNYIEYCKSASNDRSDEILCQQLKRARKLSTERLTIIGDLISPP
ncbi:MAG: hypothetical protein E7486_06950 [Ruminococcaceae bacterium]|nr:hypothetical protein [Oscillospiraceae bacterium]